MPMNNWLWMHEKKDLSYVYKDESKHGRDPDKYCAKAWQDLQQSFLDRYGLEYNQERIINLKLRFLKVGRKYLKTKKPMYRQECKLILREIEKIEKGAGGVSLGDSIISLEIYLNRDLDLSKLTIANYYDKLKYAQKHGKRADKA